MNTETKCPVCGAEQPSEFGAAYYGCGRPKSYPTGWHSSCESHQLRQQLAQVTAERDALAFAADKSRSTLLLPDGLGCIVWDEAGCKLLKAGHGHLAENPLHAVRLALAAKQKTA